MRVIAGSRPFIESFFAKRVHEIPNIEFVTNVVGTGFVAEQGQITGIRLKNRDGEETVEPANLLMDATGRGSQLPKWLVDYGAGRVPEEVIHVKVGYATARFRRSTADRVNLYALIIGASPDVPRGGIAQCVENDVLQVSMAAYSDSPPTNLEDFMEYAKTLPQPDIHDWMQGAEPLGDIKTHGVPKAFRRKYEKVRGMPKGLLAIADSICSFNPVYAQGMTVAAVEAQILDECLDKGLHQLQKRYFKSIRSVTDVTWQMGSTTDLSMPIVEGNLSLPSRLIASWISRVQQAGTQDPFIAEKFIRVAALLDPPTSLLSPGFIWRVLRCPKPQTLEPGVAKQVSA